jgi:hypothetical protein
MRHQQLARALSWFSHLQKQELANQRVMVDLAALCSGLLCEHSSAPLKAALQMLIAEYVHVLTTLQMELES